MIRLLGDDTAAVLMSPRLAAANTNSVAATQLEGQRRCMTQPAPSQLLFSEEAPAPQHGLSATPFFSDGAELWLAWGNVAGLAELTYREHHVWTWNRAHEQTRLGDLTQRLPLTLEEAQQLLPSCSTSITLIV